MSHLVSLMINTISAPGGGLPSQRSAITMILGLGLGIGLGLGPLRWQTGIPLRAFVGLCFASGGGNYFEVGGQVEADSGGGGSPLPTS